jgi:ADP-dependent NAD(P)H-hydrate dehydratase
MAQANEKPKRIKTVPPVLQRKPEAHKGHFGRVLVLAGSAGMIGAPGLVSLSALRSGAGLVTIAVPEKIQPTVASLCPCATSIPLPQTPTGQIDPVAARKKFQDLGYFDTAGNAPDVLVTGPGLGTGPAEYGQQMWELINAFRNVPLVPAVIDADALNLTAKSGPERPDGWDNQYHFRTVITPHPGELARMHNASTRDIQSDREGFALRTARMMSSEHKEPEYTPVVVLKGAGTVVTDGHRLYVNKTGNPGMATGGSGDVLSGLIGSLIGQGMDTFNAAVTGVHLHGLAGDLAAKKLGQISLIASDLIDFLPQAFQKFSTPTKKK